MWHSCTDVPLAAFLLGHAVSYSVFSAALEDGQRITSANSVDLLNITVPEDGDNGENNTFLWGVLCV